jgi:hypothetical protein
MIAALDRQLADEYIGQESGSDTSQCPSLSVALAPLPRHASHPALSSSLLKWFLVRR